MCLKNPLHGSLNSPSEDLELPRVCSSICADARPRKTTDPFPLSQCGDSPRRFYLTTEYTEHTEYFPCIPCVPWLDLISPASEPQIGNVRKPNGRRFRVISCRPFGPLSCPASDGTRRVLLRDGMGRGEASRPNGDERKQIAARRSVAPPVFVVARQRQSYKRAVT